MSQWVQDIKHSKIFLWLKGFQQDIDSMWQNITVTKCQIERNTYFNPKTESASIQEGAIIQINMVFRDL